MARPKQPGDDQAAVELDRMAQRFDIDAEYYDACAANSKKDDVSVWASERHQRESIAYHEASAVAFRRAARDLRRRASRLRNGTAGR